MLRVSGAEIGCILQVALGRPYPREIKLRSRDVAGKRQAFATRIRTRNFPRQGLNVWRIYAFAEQGPAQSMTSRIA